MRRSLSCRTVFSKDWRRGEDIRSGEIQARASLVMRWCLERDDPVGENA